MIRSKQLLGVFLFTLLPGLVIAQNNTNSPYTRYGYGQLSDQTSSKSRGMGGVGYGIRDNFQINLSNPASYTAVDSLTFLFEGGITLQNTNFSDGTTKLNAKNSSFDYAVMQFRLHKRVAMSLGVLPYSNVGYNFGEYQEDIENPNATAWVNYLGEGGLHQGFIGLGFNVFKNFSIGANVSYFWGDIDRTRSVLINDSYANSIEELTNLSVKDFKFDIGAQYTHVLDKKNLFTVGAVFSPKRNLSNDSYIRTQTGNTQGGYVSHTKDTVATFGIPMTIGAGLSYTYDQRLTVGLDFTMQKWASVEYMDNPDYFTDRMIMALGVEYLPSYTGHNYLSHIKYRLGGYYSQPYYKVSGSKAKEYGISGGIALPLPRTRSSLNISAQYVRVDGQGVNMLKENYLKINIGLTFNERWFFKRKVD